MSAKFRTPQWLSEIQRILAQEPDAVVTIETDPGTPPRSGQPGLWVHWKDAHIHEKVITFPSWDEARAAAYSAGKALHTRIFAIDGGVHKEADPRRRVLGRICRVG